MSAAQHRATPSNWRHAQPLQWLTMALACGALASGCGPTVLYDWGHYEESLQASYVAHDDAKAWSSLEATIASAPQTGRRIPPGACAEYGFLLYKRGQPERAIEYFQQEAQLFPESKPLMDKLITRIRKQAAADGQSRVEGGSGQ